MVPPASAARVVMGSPGAVPVGDGACAVVDARRLFAAGAHRAGDDRGDGMGRVGGSRVLRARPMGVPSPSKHTLEPGESQEQYEHEACPTPICKQASNGRDLLCLVGPV